MKSVDFQTKLICKLNALLRSKKRKLICEIAFFLLLIDQNFVKQNENIKRKQRFLFQCTQNGLNFFSLPSVQEVVTHFI